jgi:predicted TIM-barrel fold metal-dependent hydrolase
VILAHAGTVIGPAEVRKILERCPRVYAELAARDPWRYVKNPIADAGTGALLPAWETLVTDYPTRFIVGSDNVWPVDQLDRWDEPDTGWNELERFLAFHRRWLSGLPADVAHKIRYDNVRRLFGQPG